MEQKPRERSSRYDVSGNVEAEYVDAGQVVLVNKKGITDLQSLQRIEEEALAQAYELLLSEVRVATPMTCDLLRHIHTRIFGELYDWAGRWRTVWISKPGITWPAPDFLERNMAVFEKDVLLKFPARVLKEDDAFSEAAGEIQGEFLVIHPFREGNARTIKLLTDLLAVQTGRPLLIYDESEASRAEYIAAAKAAFKRQFAPMRTIIQQALARARRER
ncbi:MAG: Fic family protein [Pirellulales bacterium]|nr:Fic family protein [Pirellulales bacterium]